MLQLQSTHFTGQPSQLANAFIIERADHFLIALSLSGPEARSVIEQIKEKIDHAEIDSPSSFMSLLERVQELWSGLFGEMTAIYAQDGKIYLMCKNGEVWLHRGEKFGRVLKSSDELRVVEGRVQDHDMYLILTQSSSVALTDLFASLSELRISFVQALQQIQDKINYSGLSDRCAIGVVETLVTPEENPLESSLPPSVVNESLSSHQSKFSVAAAQLKKVKEMIRTVKPHIKAATQKIVDVMRMIPELKKARPTREQRKKIAVVLISLAVLGITILGILGWRVSQIRKGEAFLLPFQQKLFSLQVVADSDSVAARDQVLVLQKEFESQRGPFDKSFFVKTQVGQFSDQLNTFIKDVSGKVELQTLPIFYDFRLIRADFIASRADTEQNTGIFLDAERQVAIALTMDTKQQTTLPIGEYPSLKDLSYSGEQVYLLSDGVYQFPIDSQSAAKKVIPEGDSNRDGKFLRNFGEYVYVLNPEKRNLYRYTIRDDDATEAPQPIGWFQDKKDLDFPSISSFAIDGNVWLGTQQGQILRYERGNPIVFNIQGLQEPFSSTVRIYTKEDLDSIFVIESAKNRVVRLSKDGVFIKQIQSPSLGAATDIIFSSTTGKAYALAGSLVYELAL